MPNNDEMLHVSDEAYNIKETKTPRNWLLLGTIAISVIVLIAVMFEYRYYMSDNNTLSGSILGIIVQITFMPHIILCVVAIILACLGLYYNTGWYIFAAAILYTVATAVMTNRFYYSALQAVLYYVAYMRMKQ